MVVEILDVINDDGELAGMACNGAITLGDDDYSSVLGLGFDFPFMGYNWDSVYVASNGYLTFGVGTNDRTESVGVMIGFWPSIAGLYDDLDPSSAGTVTCSRTATSMTISYTAVPEWPSSGANTFAITMNDDGSIEVMYGAISATDGLAGI